MKDFVVTNFSEYFKYIKEEQNLRKVDKLLYIFQITPDDLEKYVQSTSSDNCIHNYNLEILNLFDPELQMINTKPVIKNIAEEMFMNKYGSMIAQKILNLYITEDM